MTLFTLPDRITPKQASEALGVTIQTLSVWRCTQRYPLPYMKIGRKVFYRMQDIHRFIEHRTVRPQETE